MNRSIRTLAHFTMALLIWLGSSMVTSAETLSIANPNFQAGINVLLLPTDYSSLDELDWKTDALLDTLQSLGVNAINIDWLLYTKSVRSNHVTVGEKTPDIAAIVLVAAKARGRGFTVGLRPIIDEESIVQQSNNEWRGTIRPHDVTAWFKEYGALLVSYATLAESSDAQFLIIGTELNSMEHYSSNWKSLIREIRQVYHGKLSYSSNQLISTTIPWNMLDFISVDAFLKLKVPKSASVPELVAAWQVWIPQLVNQAKVLGLPLVFTEIGVASQTGAARRSWIWNHHTPVDLEEQRRFYEAACIVWKNRTSGIYWWMVHSNIWLIENPLNDPSFSPLGKPAALEIKRCFKE